MNTAGITQPQQRSNLDNLTLSRKEGWRDAVEAPKRVRPEQLTRSEIRHLSDSAADIYNQRRHDWHNNIGPLPTPQLVELHETLWDIMDSNERDGDRVKGAIALDGYPGLGKSTAVEAFAKEFHRREILRHGQFSRSGDERWPVCRIGMRGNTSMKDFNRAMCDFYAHPVKRPGSADQLSSIALDLVRSCETRLLIIDDLHFLHWQRHGGIEINNHFKYIANEYPVTLLSIGIGLAERGVLFTDASFDELLAQTQRRTTMPEMRIFELDTEVQRRQWHTLLATIEERLVLANKTQGMLADKLSDYLYIRTGGYIGSLMELIRRACVRAIRSHTEALNKALFEEVKIDSAAEKARKELASSFRTRRMTTKLQLQ